MNISLIRPSLYCNKIIDTNFNKRKKNKLLWKILKKLSGFNLIMNFRRSFLKHNGNFITKLNAINESAKYIFGTKVDHYT